MTYTHYEHKTKSIFCVDMRDELTKPRSNLAVKGIEKYIRTGKKVAILVSKKGYASGTICNECGHIPRCDQCDVAVAIHHNSQGDALGLCHICRREYTIDSVCKQCGGTDTTTFGLGAQQVVDRVSETFATQAVLLDNKAVSSLAKIGKVQPGLGSAQVVVGTSLLTQQITGRKPDLFIVVNADIGLNVPDFQARWHNFCLLYDCFMRSGAENFVVQTYNPEAESIVKACSLDYAGMQLLEHEYRKTYTYPPYAEMCVIHYKHEIEDRLFGATNKLYQEMLYLKQTYQMDTLELYTTPPMIYKMYGKYRYTIIAKGHELRQFMDIAYSKLRMRSRGFKIDWEPQQLL